MAMLTENPIAIAVAGALAATLAAVVFLARRTPGPLIALIAIAAITATMLIVERVVVTDREAVEASLEEVLAAIEANNVERVLAWIDPASARVRADVEALMPIVKVKTANAAAVDVDISTPQNANCEFRAYLQGVHGSSGVPLIYVNQRVDLHWVKRADRWLISSYIAYYEDQPINAVLSARGNRPVSGQ
jgi:hypothetical protein